MSRQSQLRSNALGLAMLTLFLGVMLWSGLPNLPSLSSSVEVPHQEKVPVQFLSGGASEPMPDMASGSDCVMCRSAPGPGAQSIGEKTKAVLAKACYAHLQQPVESFVRLSLSLAKAALPARIAFCRWIN
ncbi:hypothetical protein [Aquabacterium sp.]|uniref:hypothetical protein n=1 Tax=Aquabacterium sp. TaxID=1872578 RepID=UPI0035B3AD83